MALEWIDCGEDNMFIVRELMERSKREGILHSWTLRKHMTE